MERSPEMIKILVLFSVLPYSCGYQSLPADSRLPPCTVATGGCGAFTTQLPTVSQKFGFQCQDKTHFFCMVEKGRDENYYLFLLVVAVTTAQLNRIIVQFLLY